MDPNAQNILLGVTANVLTSLIAASGRVTRRLVSPAGQSREGIEELLGQATGETSDTFNWEGPGPVEEVCLFLSSNEVAAIVRQVFSVRLLGGDEQRHITDIEEEFVASLGFFLGVNNVKDAGAILFAELVRACETTLNRAIERGLLAAHEAKSSLRHKLLLEELAVIKQNIAFLTGHQRGTRQTTVEFEAKYRRQVAHRHADIIPPNFDAARRIAIDRLYVSPNVTRQVQQKQDERHPLSIAQVAPLIQRSVLLGNPGGGKSTFGQKLIFSIASNSAPPLIPQPRRTPILVILRDYGAQRKEHNESILRFIERNTGASYQIEPPIGAFEYLLRSGRAFVVFDGLDELLDTRHRQDIARDIELFCSLFPSASVLVTSRQVGYEQAPLDPTRFEAFLLEPFTDEQVQEYVTKWFDTDFDLTAQQKQEKSRAFFSESRIVADLCANPLMLALMCNIYRGENYIPTNRPDVYEKCAVMLFERWDKGRGIKVPLPIEASVRPAMMHLAHWIYAEEALQSGVTERKLIAKTTEYLCPKRFEDHDEAEQAARQFIDFCRGRAWVFTDTGTTKEGDRLYQFTHRTFLEYFTGAQLVRTHPTPQQLFGILLPRIEKREWDVVAQLAFQIQNKNVEGAGDDLLSALEQAARRKPTGEAWSILSFATRCLEFIVPSPRICRQLTVLTLDMVCRDHTAAATNVKRGELDPREAVIALVGAARENQRSIRETFEAVITERINSADSNAALLAAEVALHLNVCLHVPRASSQRADNFWQQFSERIRERCWPRLESLAHDNLLIALDGFWHGKLSIQVLLEWFGTAAIFTRRMFRAFAPVIHSSPAAEWIVVNLLNPDRKRPQWNPDETLRSIGKWLLTASLPWAKREAIGSQHHFMPYLRFRPGLRRARLHSDSDQTFAIFGILAVALEAVGDRAKDLIKELEAVNLPVLTEISVLLTARLSNMATLPGLSVDSNLGLDDKHSEFVRRWVDRDFDLVG